MLHHVIIDNYFTINNFQSLIYRMTTYKCERNGVIYYILLITIIIIGVCGILTGFYMYLLEFAFKLKLPFWKTISTFGVVMLLLTIVFFTYKNEVDAVDIGEDKLVKDQDKDQKDKDKDKDKDKYKITLPEVETIQMAAF